MQFRNVNLFLLGMLLLVAGSVGAQEASLPEAIAESKRENPSIKAGVWRVRRQESEVNVARSALLPDLVAAGDFTRYENPTLVTPLRDPRSLPELDDQIYSGSVSLRAPLLNLVAFSKVNAARRSVETEVARGAQIEQRVLSSVAEVFVQSEQVNDSVELLESHIDALKQRQEELRLLSEEGRVSPADLAVVEAAVQSARSDRLRLLTNRDSLAIRLGSLLGREDPIHPKETSFVAPDRAPSPGETGPALEIADAQLEAAEAAKAASRLAFVPQLDGFAAQVARSGSDLDFEMEWSAGLQLTVPILTGGERKARMRSAEHSLEGARSALENARHSYQASLRVAEAEMNSARRRGELIRSAIENRERSVTATERRYEEGRASLSDLLSEEAELLDLRFEERRLLYSRILSLISYYETTGELSQSFFEGLIKE